MSTSLKRLLLAGVLSLLLHLLVVVAGFWSFDFGMGLDLDLGLEFAEIELIDIDAEQAEDGHDPSAQEEVELEPIGPVLPSELPGETEQENKEDAPEEKKKQFGEKKSKIDKLAPTNATFSMMLANKRIRRLPFADEAADIMAPLPDFEYIITDGGFDTWRDFNYIVIASPNVMVVSQTFLAVQYKLSTDELKAGLARASALRGLTLDWETKGSVQLAHPRPIDGSTQDVDPRWFVLLEKEKVAMYVREEYLPQIIEGPKSKKKTASNFVANIARMRRFTSQEPKAGLQLKFKDLRSFVKRASKIPFELPDDIEVMAEAASKPQITIRLSFVAQSHAQDFVRFWEHDLKAIIEDRLHLRIMVGADYRSTVIEAQGKDVLLRNQFSKERTQFILGLLSQQSRRMMKRSEEEMSKKRRLRDQLRTLRKKGNLSPSEALAAQQALQTGDAGDDSGSDSTESESEQTGS